MLSQYGPALLVRCQEQIDFGRELVVNWLKAYMFRDEETDLPNRIAEYLSNHANFKTHGKHLNTQNAISSGLKVEMLEENQEFQDIVLSAFHATMHAFGGSPSVKVIANQNGNCYVKQVNVQVQKPTGGPPTALV